MESRPLDNIPLSSSTLSLLLKNGFSTVDDVINLRPSELAGELQIEPSEALDILSIIKKFSLGTIRQTQTQPQTQSFTIPASNDRITVQTAWEVIQEYDSLPTIPTLCEPLDDLLRRGIPVGSITEFCGSPGSGKTQMCIQLCLSVQLPASLFGPNSEAVYIDTEGSFMPDRAAMMAESLSTHIPQAPTVQEFLTRIHVYRPHSHTTLLATVRNLPTFLEQHPHVHLIVIDSISAPLRHQFEDGISTRNLIITEIASALNSIAKMNKIAVVCTNQLTTKPPKSQPQSEPQQEAQLLPALGDVWTQHVTHRIVLRMALQKQTLQPIRIATVLKSPVALSTTSTPFTITADGIRSSSSQTADPTDLDEQNEWEVE
ncbi:putative DNA repair protein RAD51 [Blattamonas nauphoetae]|uniref:DNA repair protein RAD51 homolog 3 n=1 Tax=Blattamonas nauphoetae TaxID=2049346 RepID=A0ABQ9YCF8_9EUKA|nr:putative DNA repair protein RAD51 [Blattamonas nauphoetae]